ncbi:hypothetical protein SVI_2868 [Shewanella violacea DSS12]|uniref:Uncharacterized protein n=1 Tax=Shewanella violacea (strain JCM 10179 / CIP 106290 / LMG 19151 / DSS12) TaxID=637905 RepID=D4ZME0_SHEVD|nr:hypothetical protein SVI_2868 [Shewanella violacea DSS12]
MWIVSDNTGESLQIAKDWHGNILMPLKGASQPKGPVMAEKHIHLLEQLNQ